MFPGWHFVEHLMKPRLHEHLKLVQGPLHSLEVLLAEVVFGLMNPATSLDAFVWAIWVSFVASVVSKSSNLTFLKSIKSV